MGKCKLTFFIVVIALLAFALVSCKSDTPTAQPGLANPASVYCQGLGFTEETRTSDLGQSGVCIFPDSTECDTWDFLAGRCGQEHSYCLKQGGKLQTNDTNIATCVFEDGSTCNELEYFQGQCKPGQNKP